MRISYLHLQWYFLHFPGYHILAPLLYISLSEKNTISSCNETFPSFSLKDSLANQNEILYFCIDFRTPISLLNLYIGQLFLYCLLNSWLKNNQSKISSYSWEILLPVLALLNQIYFTLFTLLLWACFNPM